MGASLFGSTSAAFLVLSVVSMRLRRRRQRKASSESFLVRLLSANDKEAILGEISDGIYGGNDYLPNCWPIWSRQAHRKMYGVFIGEELVGFEVLSLFDAGKTAMFQALRVHQAHRSKGVAKHISKHISAQVRRMPNVKRSRVACHLWDEQGKRSCSMQIKNGFSSRLELSCFGLEMRNPSTSNNPTNRGECPYQNVLSTKCIDALPEAQLELESDVSKALQHLKGLSPGTPLFIFDWEVFDLTEENLSSVASERKLQFLVGYDGQGRCSSVSVGGESPRCNGLQVYCTIYTDSLAPAHADATSSCSSSSRRGAALLHMNVWAREARRTGGVKLVTIHDLCEPLLSENVEGWDVDKGLTGGICILEKPT